MSKFVGDDEEAKAILRQMKEPQRMNTNPWARLPEGPPYVLSEDVETVAKFNAKRDREHVHYLHVDKILPEPFVGAKDAPVLLLSNNPGFSDKEEKLQSRQSDIFRSLMWKNLLHKLSDYPFVYLNPALGPNDNGNRWWQHKFKHLLNKFDAKVVARSVLNVVFFPYPSREYKHLRTPLPSQQYNFDLVAEAVKREAIIVSMRPGRDRDWLKAVPELQNYKRFFRVKNPQTPTISPNNCEAYQEVENAIAVFSKR
jgi:hypothetical protein